MESPINVPDFLSRPLGADYPKELHDQLKRKFHCRICIGDSNEYIPARLKIRFDSQQPWLDVRIGEAHIVFPATQTYMKLVIKGISRQYDAFIQAHQKSATEVKKDNQACFFELSPSAKPVFAGPLWELKGDELERWSKLQAIEWPGEKVFIWIAFPDQQFDVFRNMQIYMAKLVDHVRKNVSPNGRPRLCWYAEQHPLADGEKAPRRPKMPWLFDADGNYNAWDTPVDFFLDDEDRRSKPHSWNDILSGPPPPEGIRVDYHVGNANPDPQTDIRPVIGNGFCMGSSRADFAILTRAHFDPALDGQARKIMATVQVDLKSVNLQIDALVMAGRTISFGDSTKSNGNGFSLRRTILAQASELSSKSPFYFELNVKDISEVPADLQKERINYIQQKYKLDESQTRAVQKSVFKVVAGVHLVKGPPGNGKTRTTLVMMLILASLGMKVLVCAGSNQAVDTLLLAFHEALTKWVFFVVQVKRSDSVQRALEDCQIEALVVKTATDFYDDRPEAKQLLDLLDQDRERVLSKDDTILLRRCYENVLRLVIGQCKVVAVTLNASCDENLKIMFQPYALLCDEAGQCLEGDSMIPMTLYHETLRTITLIGDPGQLPPTVISSCENEGANFHARSLMSRLARSYPLTLLEINYRCHPDILAWPASAIYKSEITPSEQNAKPERVGRAWDAFTASRHHFKGNGLAGKRRLVIDADGQAEKPSGSTSWRNDAHIKVVITLLRALYAYRATQDRIYPEDVTLICPYKEQVKRVIERFSAEGVGYKRCLTVDGSQGQESNIVIFMFTKPRTNSMAEVGFMSSYQRLNLALTRAKKLLIVAANLRIWNAEFVRAAKTGSSRYLAGFLKDAVDKGDVLRWVDRETVERAFDSTQPQKTATASRPTPQPRKMAAASGLTPRTQKKEQRTDTNITRSARAVDDEVAEARLQIKRMKLDDSIEAERKALDGEIKEMEARRDSLNAQQNALNAQQNALDVQQQALNVKQEALVVKWKEVEASMNSINTRRDALEYIEGEG
ncbi:hypothetical protein ACN42_g6634 [Penicillium freii]|uniref:DNA2/NAM7 helicase-like C-terminal domain-containing protein n=1 Tax=Penicillium freii TaxID=48697 RepID=A0A101MHG1_PENFR|nr:hypothetical protein ACN42_g6634 [Penicillium freii]